MSLILLLVFTLAIFAVSSDASWCICNSQLNTTALQKTLDYACGAGADCSPIQQSGSCYNPNTVAAHCSYAVNSFYQKKNQAQGTCDFAGTASVTQTDPSTGNGCTYPATPGAAGNSSTPSSTTPPTTTTSPTTLTPPAGTTTTGGGVLGLGPSSGANFDNSQGRVTKTTNYFLFTFITLTTLFSFMKI